MTETHTKFNIQDFIHSIKELRGRQSGAFKVIPQVVRALAPSIFCSAIFLSSLWLSVAAGASLSQGTEKMKDKRRA